MKRTPVTSSNLKSVGYQDGTLEVEFVANGRVYQYFDVSPLTYRELMHADSIGTYFTGSIRDGYETREVIVEPTPDFGALVDGITVWQDEDQRGVYLDHAARLYGLGLTNIDVLRAILDTLYRTAVVNEVTKAANEVIRDGVEL